MFDNIGGKIKKLAKVLAIIGIVVSVIAGIIVMAAKPSYGYGYSFSSGVGFFPGLLMMVLGALGSWISCFMLYGFGELIETNQTIAARLTDKPSSEDK